MSVYKCPHETHERWLQEGKYYLEAVNKNMYAGRADIVDDCAHELARVVAYYLISQGAELENIFWTAIEKARGDWADSHWLMNKQEKHGGEVS